MTIQDITLASVADAFLTDANYQAITLKRSYLEPATTTSLGAIKVGANLTIDNNGVLAASGAIADIWNTTAYRTSDIIPPSYVIVVTYSGVIPLAQVQADFPVGSILTTTFVTPPPNLEFEVGQAGVQQLRPGVFYINTRQPVPTYVAGSPIIQIKKNNALLRFGDGVVYDSNEGYAISIDKTSIIYGDNGALSASPTAPIWLTGNGQPSDMLGIVGNYYQDTSQTNPGNRIWLKTQSISPAWTRQINFENAIQSYYGGALNFGFARVATTANIALTGLQTIDGIALAIGDAVLVRLQTNSADNGLYVAQSGAWTRVVNPVVTQGLVVSVSLGNTNVGSSFIQTLPIVTVGISAQAWALFSTAGAPSLQLVCNVGSTTSTGMTIGGPLTVGPSNQNSLTLSGSTSSVSPTIQAAGPGTSIDLLLGAKGSSTVILGNSSAGQVAVKGASSGSAVSISAVGVTNQNMQFLANGSGTVILGNSSSGQVAITGASSGSAVSISVYGSSIDLQLTGQGTSGSVILGGGSTNAGLSISNSASSNVLLSAFGNAQKIDIILQPKGGGSVYPIGLNVSNLNVQPQLYVASGLGTYTIGAGTLGQVLTSGGPSYAPYWGPSPATRKTVITVSIPQSNINPSTRAFGSLTSSIATFTTRYNDLNLTINTSTGGVSGWVSGANYLIEVTMGLATASAITGSYPWQSFWGLLASSSATAQSIAAYGEGCLVNVKYSPNLSVTTWLSSDSFGIFNRDATAFFFYSWYSSSGASQATGNMIVTISRLN